MDTSLKDWLDLWPYAALMIVLGAWIVYHFLAPASWRDWAGAGLLQAFIIALYAEMYGFPLTLYFLTSILPIDIPLVHVNGHLWAALLGYGLLGATIEMAVGITFVMSGLLLVVKGWVQVHAFGDRLLTEGVYGLVRHPQYAGIFLIILGQLIHWPTLPTLALSPVIIWAYVRLARREEARLIERFGDAARDYQRQVPMFIPRWSTLRPPISVT